MENTCCCIARPRFWCAPRPIVYSNIECWNEEKKVLKKIKFLRRWSLTLSLSWHRLWIRWSASKLEWKRQIQKWCSIVSSGLMKSAITIKNKNLEKLFKFSSSQISSSPLTTSPSTHYPWALLPCPKIKQPQRPKIKQPQTPKNHKDQRTHADTLHEVLDVVGRQRVLVEEVVVKCFFRADSLSRVQTQELIEQVDRVVVLGGIEILKLKMQHLKKKLFRYTIMKTS